MNKLSVCSTYTVYNFLCELETEFEYIEYRCYTQREIESLLQ